jgi:predicted RNase H-like nuclease
MNGTPWWRRLLSVFEPGEGRRGTSRAGAAAGTGKGARAARPAGVPRPGQPQGRPGRLAAIEATRPVLGLAVTRSGWVGALLDPSGHGTPHLLDGVTLEEVVGAAGDVTVVALDVPVGLPDEGRRAADVQARKELGARASAVLTTPVREAVYAATFGEANAISREKVGSGLSQQAYALRRRIIEVDAYVRHDLPFRLVEVVPELSYAQLAGAPMTTRRGSAEGSRERREALAVAGIYTPAHAPVGVPTEAMLDACAAAWTAHRVKAGEARSLPDAPATGSDGITSAIVV